MILEEAIALAYSQLDFWKLTQAGWSIALDERTRVLGHCCYKDKVITLSVLHVEQHDEKDILNTIRHEIAHALVGPGHNHDERWQAYARIVGAKPEPWADCCAPKRRRTSQSNVIYL